MKKRTLIVFLPLMLVFLVSCVRTDNFAGSCQLQGGHCQGFREIDGQLSMACKEGFKPVEFAGTQGCAKSQVCCLPEESAGCQPPKECPPIPTK